jgi:hypothetical protein
VNELGIHDKLKPNQVIARALSVGLTFSAIGLAGYRRSMG